MQRDTYQDALEKNRPHHTGGCDGGDRCTSKQWKEEDMRHISVPIYLLRPELTVKQSVVAAQILHHQTMRGGCALSIAQLAAEIGIDKRTVQTAIARMVDLGIAKITHAQTGTTIAIDIDALTDGRADLLYSRTLSYYPAIAAIVGSPVAAIMLSQILYLDHVTPGAGVARSMRQWARDLFISTETARKALERLVALDLIALDTSPRGTRATPRRAVLHALVAGETTEDGRSARKKWTLGAQKVDAWRAKSGRSAADALDAEDNIYNNKDIVARADAPRPTPTPGDVWKLYSQLWEQKYGCPPIRNAKVMGQIAHLLERVPKHAVLDLVRYYMGSRDYYHRRRKHAIGCLLADAEQLTALMLAGKQPHDAPEASETVDDIRTPGIRSLVREGIEPDFSWLNDERRKQ